MHVVTSLRKKHSHLPVRETRSYLTTLRRWRTFALYGIRARNGKSVIKKMPFLVGPG